MYPFQNRCSTVADASISPVVQFIGMVFGIEYGTVLDAVRNLAALGFLISGMDAALDWIGVGFFIVFVFLVVGCFLDAIPAIIIVGTVLQPLAESVHMHPVSFAIISIVALAFGLVTPPYGMCLMVSCAIAKVRLRYALKDTMIMLVPMLLVLAAMIVWPQIPLWLPRLIRPDFLN